MTPQDTRRHIQTQPWEPGQTGKGFVRGKRVFTWTTNGDDGNPTHSDGAWALGMHGDPAMLVIDPDGNFGIHYPDQYAAERIASIVEAHHPDLHWRQLDPQYGYQTDEF